MLQRLRLQELKEEPLIIHAASFKVFHRCNMSNCVLVVSCKNFTNKDDQGIFVWQYNAETKFYALHIIISRSLYESSDMKLRIKRKATGIHEFTHCVAAMMTFSRLQTAALIELLHTRMAGKFHALKKYELENIFRELSQSYEAEPRLPPMFPDEHFRTGGEDFTDGYDDLLQNFLLSFALFCEDGFFDGEKQKKFRELYKAGKNKDAVDVIVSVIDPLAEKKALDKHFVIRRIGEEFLRLIVEAARKG